MPKMFSSSFELIRLYNEIEADAEETKTEVFKLFRAYKVI